MGNNTDDDIARRASYLLTSMDLDSYKLFPSFGIYEANRPYIFLL